jgi:hypothetical protein
MPPSSPAQFPAKEDPRWSALVCGGTTRPIKLLALKFMLTRITLDVKRDPSPGMVGKAVEELHAFFAKNPQMVAGDATTLFG